MVISKNCEIKNIPVCKYDIIFFVLLFSFFPHNCDYVEKTEYKVPDISNFRHENKTDVSQ